MEQTEQHFENVASVLIKEEVEDDGNRLQLQTGDITSQQPIMPEVPPSAALEPAPMHTTEPIPASVPPTTKPANEAPEKEAPRKDLPSMVSSEPPTDAVDARSSTQAEISTAVQTRSVLSTSPLNLGETVPRQTSQAAPVPTKDGQIFTKGPITPPVTDFELESKSGPNRRPMPRGITPADLISISRDLPLVQPDRTQDPADGGTAPLKETPALVTESRDGESRKRMPNGITSTPTSLKRRRVENDDRPSTHAETAHSPHGIARQSSLESPQPVRVSARPPTGPRKPSFEASRPQSGSDISLFSRISGRCPEDCNCKLRHPTGSYKHIAPAVVSNFSNL